jgi:hypothetical protein
MEMRSNEPEVADLERRARELGDSWGKRLRAEQSRQSGLLWPGKLQDARMLVDRHLGGHVPEEEREILALIVERGARRAWQGRSGAGTDG